MADPTTQPAGALPEPVHFRALLADDQRPQQLNTAMHVCGFRDRRTAENWIASEADFKGWRYTLEPLYAEGDLRALMAERDALRRELDVWGDELPKLQAEVAALRREPEELRVTAADVNCERDNAVTAYEELRAIPPDAREGREPLTPKRAVDLLAAALRLANVMPGDTADVLYHFKQQLGPAGTSADGETQP